MASHSFLSWLSTWISLNCKPFKHPPSAKPLMSEHPLECAGSPHHRSSGWGNSKVISTHKFNDQNFCLLAAGLALLLEPNAHCLLLLVTHSWCKMLHQQKSLCKLAGSPGPGAARSTDWAAGEHSLACAQCSVSQNLRSGDVGLAWKVNTSLAWIRSKI